MHLSAQCFGCLTHIFTVLIQSHQGALISLTYCTCSAPVVKQGRDLLVNTLERLAAEEPVYFTRELNFDLYCCCQLILLVNTLLVVLSSRELCTEALQLL